MIVPGKGANLVRATHALPLGGFEQAFLPPGLFLCQKVITYYLSKFGYTLIFYFKKNIYCPLYWKTHGSKKSQYWPGDGGAHL